MVTSVNTIRLVALAALALAAACSGGGGAEDALEGGPGGGTGPAAGIEKPKLAFTTVSGFAFEGHLGKPLAGVTIATDPPTETVKTAQNGSFVITVGQAFGRLTLRASKDGWVQRAPTCVQIKVGSNSIGDVVLADAEASTDAACTPACSAESTCLGGVCVSRCNPPCSCVERCTGDGACEPDPDASATGTCGTNSHPLGSGVCECNTGFTPSGDGASCSLPEAAGSCPTGSVASGAQCVCETGLIPTPAGDRCVPPDEAAVVTAYSGADVLTSWAPPGPAPRGIAHDGAALWVGDAALGSLFRVDPATHTSVSEVALGALGSRLRDLAATPGQLFLVVAGTKEAPNDDRLYRYDVATDTLEDVGANAFEPLPGLTFDGLQLASLERAGSGVDIKRRGTDLGQTVGFSELDLDVSPVELAFSPDKGAVHLAHSESRFVTWVGSLFDGSEHTVQIAVLNAAHLTKTREISRMGLALGGSHVTGLELAGRRLYVMVGGVGPGMDGEGLPRVVEVYLAL